MSQHTGALCRPCGAVVIRTPLGTDDFTPADQTGLPTDACPWCTANDWTSIDVKAKVTLKASQANLSGEAR